MCPENVHYHGPPQVVLAYLKYQWSLGEDHKRKEAFARLQVNSSFSMLRYLEICFKSL